ncbi:MAG: hypothetical protein K1W19_08200 [Lachnospiraceae bacterium]
MFNFRIISMPDGNQIIDSSLRTPYDSLTAVQMVEYEEVYREISWIERQRKNKQKEAEQKRKLERNPLYWLVCFCKNSIERRQRYDKNRI